MRYIVDGQDLLHCSGQRIPGSCVGGHKKRERLTVKLLSSNIIESQKAHSSYFAKKRSDEAKTVFSCFVNNDGFHFFHHIAIYFVVGNATA